MFVVCTDDDGSRHALLLLVRCEERTCVWCLFAPTINDQLLLVASFSGPCPFTPARQVVLLVCDKLAALRRVTVESRDGQMVTPRGDDSHFSPRTTYSE